jgi:cell wall-associated NlpC family hydrolase
MLHEAARRYLGVPFRHQGRDPSVALDCIGLLYVSTRDIGRADLLVHDKSGYGRNPLAGLLESGLRDAFGEPVADMRAGDVVAMRDKGRAVRHVAILADYPLGGLSLIHTDSKIGRVVEHRLDERWARLIVNTYRGASL